MLYRVSYPGDLRRMSADVSFWVEGNPELPLLIAGTSTPLEGGSFVANVASIGAAEAGNNNYRKLTATVISSNHLPMTISSEDLTINWEIVKANNEQEVYGDSKNHVYVVPDDNNSPFESVVDIAAEGARDKLPPAPGAVGDEAWAKKVEIAIAVFSQFEGKAIKNVKNEPLKYWGGDPTPLTYNTVDLLAAKNGRCIAFTFLLVDALAVVGVQSTNIHVDVKATAPPLEEPAEPAPENTVLSKSFKLKNPAGQNNPAAPEFFPDHAVVRLVRSDSQTPYEPVIYDPSYGKKVGDPADQIVDVNLSYENTIVSGWAWIYVSFNTKTLHSALATIPREPNDQFLLIYK